MKPNKPNFTVREFIERARQAGHDSLGIANDPEAIATLERIARDRFVEEPTEEARERWLLLVEDLIQLLLKR